jgi:hypothetical protein
MPAAAEQPFLAVDANDLDDPVNLVRTVPLAVHLIRDNGKAAVDSRELLAELDAIAEFVTSAR